MSRHPVGSDGRLFRGKANPPLAVVPLVKETMATADDVSASAWRVRPADQDWKRTLNKLISRKPDRDQQAPDSLQYPAARREQRADHRRDAFQVTMSRSAICLALWRRSSPLPMRGPRARAGVYRHGGLSRADARNAARREAIGTQEAHDALGDARLRPSSMCCRGRRGRADLPEGTLWRDKPRSDIPGSIWLPDTGYGELAPVMADYFRAGLARGDRVATGSRAGRSIAWRIAGCRGTPPSARSRSATPMSLVSRRHHGLGKGRISARASRAGKTPGYMSSWMVRASANSRAAMTSGTWHA